MNAPLRLAIVDDYAVVIAGVASFLAAERIEVVETGASQPVISDVERMLAVRAVYLGLRPAPASTKDAAT